MCMAALAVIIAAVVPSLGRKGGPLRTEWSVSYGVNAAVFLISGLTLKSSALVSAVANWKVNILIQSFIFVVSPALFYLLGWPLYGSILGRDLVDGIVLLGMLPTTINMCVVMTTSSAGNTSAALFNATFSNILGIFISPALMFWLLGVKGSVEFVDVILSLTYRVIVPTIVGQLVQNMPSESVAKFIAAIKPHCKRTQETLLSLIVFASFSTTFYQKIYIAPGDIFIVLALMIAMQTLMYVLTWFAFGLKVLNFELADRIAGMFCSTHKTLAMGIPLITSIYDDYDNVGLYTIPLLMYHPMQIFFGSAMAPRLADMMKTESAANSEEANEEDGVGGSVEACFVCI